MFDQKILKVKDTLSLIIKIPVQIKQGWLKKTVFIGNTPYKTINKKNNISGFVYKCSIFQENEIALF